MSDVEGPWVLIKPEEPRTIEIEMVLYEPVTVTRCILTDPNKSKSVWLLESVGIDHYQLIAAYNSEEAANKALSRAENKVIRTDLDFDTYVFPITSAKLDDGFCAKGGCKHIKFGAHARNMLPEYLKIDDPLDSECSDMYRVREVKTKGRK